MNFSVDQWTDFTRHFTHLRTDALPKDRLALLTVILADAINLGLAKMAEAYPGTTFNKLDTMRAWHVRDESYSKGLAELVNYQHRLPFASHWGTGKTSSSDGQNYKVGGRGGQTGQVNLRYGSDPGVNFYTHISDQYAPYHIKAITSTIRDATHVLDGLLYHESELCIEEHYTRTPTALPITYLHCVHRLVSASRHGYATSRTKTCSCRMTRRITRRWRTFWVTKSTRKSF